MDPLSAAASVLGVVSAIGGVASATTKFMREVRSARKEMVAVKKELSSLAAVLEILADDFNDAPNTSFPESVLTQIVEIAADCRRVVTEMGDCLRAQQGSSIGWATSGKPTIEKLRGDLETHKSTLSVTLDLVSVIILRDIKSDTEKIRQDTSAIREDTGQIQNDIERVLVEISRLQMQIRAVDTAGQRPSGYILERFLTDLKSDAETVLGDADHLVYQSPYQGETSDDEDHDASPFGPDRYGPASFTPSPARSRDKQHGGKQEAAPIMFTNTQGRRYPIPFAACKTWTDMSELIRQSFAHVEESQDIKDGKYDLIGPNGEIILRSLWGSLVKPGWEVTMKMWNAPDPVRSSLSIKFKDCIGRKFTFPFHLCQTWQGMEDLIKSGFLHVEVIGPHVQEGHYDLVGTDGEIIPPSIWERVIQPNMAITMHMWPMDKMPPLRHARSTSGMLPGPGSQASRSLLQENVRGIPPPAPGFVDERRQETPPPSAPRQSHKNDRRTSRKEKAKPAKGGRSHDTMQKMLFPQAILKNF